MTFLTDLPQLLIWSSLIKHVHLVHTCIFFFIKYVMITKKRGTELLYKRCTAGLIKFYHCNVSLTFSDTVQAF